MQMYWGIRHPVFCVLDKLFEYSKIIMFMIMPRNKGKD